MDGSHRLLLSPQITTNSTERVRRRIVSFRRLSTDYDRKVRAIHELHRYPGKIIPQIPYWFLRNGEFVNERSIIGDFFCGSGTVLVESAFAGKHSIGVDINPLAALLSRVKTTPLNQKSLEHSIEKLLNRINSASEIRSSIPDFPNRDYWFSKTSSKQLSFLKESIETTDIDENVKNFLLASYCSIIRKSSNADPQISPPVFSKEMRRANAQGRRVHVIRNFREALEKNTRRISSFSRQVKTAFTEVHQGDVRDINLKKSDIDLIITSPPYLDAQKYMRSSKLELYWMGISQRQFVQLDRSSIGSELTSYLMKPEFPQFGLPFVDDLRERVRQRNPERGYALDKYLFDIRDVLISFRKPLRCGGHLVLVIGNNKIAGRRVPVDRCIELIAESVGFNWMETLVDTIKSRGFMTKRNKTAGIIDSERIIVMRNESS